MIISRRQRDSLLDEVSRMLANKQNVAFANHAKIADRISNGDNALYIDSTKKEFVMKYGNNNIRFSAKDKQISDINNILFSNNSTIEGITSNPVSNDKLSISAKWAYNHYQDTLKRMKKWDPEGLNILTGYSNIVGVTDEGKYSEQHILTYEYWQDHKETVGDGENEHNHDNRYALKDHQHPEYSKEGHVHSEYSLTTHQHPEYAKSSHSHPEYAWSNHSHSNYASSNHTHSQYLTKKEIIDLIEDETETPWYEKLFNGLHIVNEVAQDGYIFWMQSQIANIYSILTGNGLIDSSQTASITGVGAVATGVASKLLKVADGLSFIGEKFQKVNGIITKITTPLRNLANHIQGYQQIFDVIDDVRDLAGWTQQTAHTVGQIGSLDEYIESNLLPDTIETVTKGKATAEKILNNGYSKFIDMPHSSVAM